MIYIEFPTSVSATNTAGEKVVLTNLKDNTLFNAYLDANSRLQISNLKSGNYQISFVTSTFSSLDIASYNHAVETDINTTEDIIDIVSVDIIDSSDSDTITHNFATTNYIAEVVSQDASTLGQVINAAGITINANTCVITGIQTAGFTKYKVTLFKRG